MCIVRGFVGRWGVAMVMGLFFSMVGLSFADSEWRQFERGGLSFHYPADLKRMGAASTEKIRGMLNRQLQAMGNTHTSITELDVLLKLPVFRVMITKEHFVSDPTPAYLIQERQAFLAEAQKQGALNSYGDLRETRIAGHPAVVLTDVDRGRQGFESEIRILCGGDAWHVTFAGDTRKSYEYYKGHVEQIMNSMEVKGPCQKSGKVLH